MQLCKRAITLLLQAFCVMLVVASCIKDNVDEPVAGGSSSNVIRRGKFYLAFKIHTSSDSFTRAENETDIDKSESGQLWDGTNEEQIAAAGNYLLLFYGDDVTIEDEEGNKKEYKKGEFHSCLPLLWNDKVVDPDKKGEHEHDTPFDGSLSDDIGEAVYWAWYNDGDSYFPKSCYCFVILNASTELSAILSNPESEGYQKLENLKMEDFKSSNVGEAFKDLFVWSDKTNPNNIGYRKETVDGKEKTYFTMTNSTFVNNNKFTDEEGLAESKKKEEEQDREIIDMDDVSTWQWQSSEYPSAVYVPDTSLFILEEQPTRTSNSITIYVERMVAKFSLTVKPENIVGGNNLIFYPHVNEEGLPVTDGSYTDLIMFDGFTDSTDPTPDDDKSAIGGLRLKAVPWRVKVTGWGINGLERESYLFKKINKEKTYFTGWTNWNEADYHRSYWTEDLHFNNPPNDYPWQFRRAIDNFDGITRERFKYYSAEENLEDNVLKNYSFNGLELGGTKKIEDNTTIDVEKSFGKIIYTPENTYDWDVVKDDDKLLDYRNELLACTHLLVGAELQIMDDEDKHKCSEPKIEDGYFCEHDWYRDRNGFFYRSERECFAALVHAFNQTLKSQSTMLFTPYNWDTGGLNTDYGTVMAEVKNPSSNEWYQLCVVDDNGKTELLSGPDILKMTDEKFYDTYGGLSPATIRGGDGKQLPWPSKLEVTIGSTDGVTTKATALDYFMTQVNSDGSISKKESMNDKGEWVPDPPIVLDDAGRKNFRRSLFYEWVGPVDHYSKGRMYYSHGIDNPMEGESTADNTRAPKRYGVVRNNWYRFVLSGIESLGTPVDDPNQPIIPERVDNRDQINVSISILDWHLVETSIPDFPN